MLGEKLVIKMWETIADKGIGSLLAPWQILRESDARIEARRREIILLAEAEKQALDIKNGVNLLSQDESLKIENLQKRIEPILDFENIASIAHSNIRQEQIREEININKAVIYAEESLAEDQQEPPERDVDDDWLYRWKENASKVSIENLQQIWGKVLAGEIKSPGTYSLRTLDFLKNISQYEARLIETVAQFSISGCIARDETEILEENNLNYGSFIALQELGIIHGVEALGMALEFSSNIPESYQKVLISNGKALLITHKDNNKKVSINAYGISNLGKQVLSLGSFSHNNEYLISIGKKILKEGFDVQLGDWLQKTDKYGQLLNAASIEIEENKSV